MDLVISALGPDTPPLTSRTRTAKALRLRAAMGAGAVTAGLAVLLLHPGVHVPMVVPHADKFAHVTVFGALVLPAALSRRGAALAWLVPLLLVLGTGFELLQGYSGRSASLGDAVANAAGVALGLAVGRTHAWRARSRRVLRPAAA